MPTSLARDHAGPAVAWLIGARAAIVALACGYALSTLVPASLRPSWLDTWFYSVVLVGICGLALARPVLARQDRRVWTCVGLAVTSWAVGDLYWTSRFASVTTAEIRVPSPADLCYVAMYPLAYAGLILLVRVTAQRVPAAVLLDGVISALAAGAVFAAVALDEVLSLGRGGSLAETVTNLSYPIGDLVLMVVSVGALAMVRWRPEATWWLLGLGAAFFAVADMAYLFGLDNGTYTDGTWPDGVWVIGLTLMASAGAVRPTAPAGTTPGPRTGRDPRTGHGPRTGRGRRTEAVDEFVALVVPMLSSLSALAVLVVGAFAHLHPIAVLLAAGCLLAAWGRTALTFEQTRQPARSWIPTESDALSGLGNRRLLEARLEATLAGLTPGWYAVLTIVGADHVSELNSLLGYPAGDTVVNTLGARLRAALPTDAVCARLGGVEVAVLRTVADANPAEVERYTRTLLSRLAVPVTTDGVPVEIELSAGVAAAPVHAGTPAELIRCAADALWTARRTRSGVEVFEPDADAGADPRLLPELLRAIADNELATCYRPAVDAGTGRPTVLLAALYWQHGTHGRVDQAALLALAARAGRASRLTRLLLESATRDCARWRRRGTPVGVAVDLTADDLRDCRLPCELARLLTEVRLPAGALALRVPEEILVGDRDRTDAVLDQLRQLGVTVALDGYGRSVAAPARLRTLPVDELRLDPGFVHEALSEPDGVGAVRSTLELADAAGIAAVVESPDPGLPAALAAAGCRPVTVLVSGRLVRADQVADLLR